MADKPLHQVYSASGAGNEVQRKAWIIRFEGTLEMDGTIGMGGGLGLSKKELKRKFNLLTNRSHAWPAPENLQVHDTFMT
jgi:hypothetical protein